VELLSTKASTLNANVAAIALVTVAFSTLVLTHTSLAFSTLRIVTITTLVFSVWAFVYQMVASVRLQGTKYDY